MSGKSLLESVSLSGNLSLPFSLVLCSMSEVVAVFRGLQRYRGDFMGVFASPGEG